jgi:hypothetical protein
MIETCDLQKSLLLGLAWTFDYSGHGCKALLWGNFGWEIKVTFQTIGNNGQGNGLGLEGSYLRFHKTFANLWPYFWSWVPETNLGPLRYELGARNVHREAIHASFYTSHEWIKGILVETLEPIRCVEGSSKIPKTWILEWNFW